MDKNKNKMQEKNEKALTLEQLHKEQVKILKVLTKFFDDNNLSYFLAGGTLLGAIRHKGFIPWDDDIDLLMPRPDYEKFKELTFNKPITKNIIVQSVLNKDAIYSFCKVCNINYRVKEEMWKESDNSYLWIDIFPMDGLSENEAVNVKLFKKVHSLRHLLSLKIMDKSKVKESATTKLKSIIKPIYKVFVDLIPLKVINNKIEKISRTYDYEKCEYIGCLHWGYGPQERLKKVDVEKKIKVEFEGMQLDAFSCWDEYLHNLFGDYMTLPPIEKRQVHLAKIEKINNIEEE